MNNIELHVFDIHLNRLGIIDTIQSVSFQRFYYNHSVCNLTVENNKTNAELLLVNSTSLENELRIICRSDDLTRGYLVETIDISDTSSTIIELEAKSLSYMLNWRLVLNQQRYYGTLTSVFNSFVTNNCMVGNRTIPRLVLGDSEMINTVIDETSYFGSLDFVMWEMCSKYEASYEILINHSTKQFEFTIFKGKDRSILQNVNPHIIFAKEFENVVSQAYADDKANYRSTCFVVGEGEGEDLEKTIVEVNQSVEGFNRREVFINVSDVKKKYEENGQTITLTDSEYQNLLKESGINRLQDYKRIQTFQSDVNPQSNFIYGIHYFLGDKVTNRNKEMNIVTHSRIVSSTEKITRNGYSLNLEFGTSIPTLLDKIKREVK